MLRARFSGPRAAGDVPVEVDVIAEPATVISTLTVERLVDDAVVVEQSSTQR